MKIEVILENLDLFSSGQDEVSRLRDLIIELSVKGRLTVGDSSDIPADVLLASTALERIKLEKLKAIRARQTLPGEYLDKPYQIPKNWAWARLSDVGYELGQKTPENTFTYIDVGSIDPKLGRISDRVEQIEANQAPSRARKIVAEGTVIYSTVRPYLRNIAIVEKAFEPEPIASTAFGILHPFSGINNRYLFYWLRSKQFNAYVEKSMKGVAYPAINDEKFYSGYIPVPPTKEQDRIVAKVDELMALCDRLEAQLKERDVKQAALAKAALAKFTEDPTQEKLELLFHPYYVIPPAQLRKLILALAFQGKLVPQDPTEEPADELLARLAHELTPEQRRNQAAPLTTIPDEALQYALHESWRWTRFRDVAIIASNLVKPEGFLDFTHLAPDNIEKGNGLLLPCRSVREDKVISSNHRFYPGQIVYSKIRPSLSKVVVVDFEGLCSADMYPVNALINVFYLQLYMLSDSFLVQAVRSDTRVAMPKINQAELNAIAVPVPPLAEQRRIVVKVHQLIALVDKLEAQLAASRTTGEKLLEAMVAELTA
jgi:type I restriction enzyme S subunit